MTRTVHAGPTSKVPHMPDTLVDELDATITMLGRLFGARHGHACEDGSLNAPQFLTLRVLAEAGPSKQADLAASLGVKAPAVSALIDGLEEAQLVQRAADPDDRRVTLVSVTDLGRDALLAAEVARRGHMRRYLSVLEADDVRTLIRIHRKLIEAMVTNEV